MQASDFDKWREEYDSMSFAQHADFYKRLHEDHPDQSHFDAEGVKRLIEKIELEAIVVVELGGYDGGLAKACLEAYPDKIIRWSNYDIAPAEEQKAEDPRYKVHTLRSPFLNLGAPDLFVASHVLEHLSEGDMQDVLWLARGIPYLYIDCPLDDRGKDGWKGTTAAHKLEMTWEQLEERIGDEGYDRLLLEASGRAYRIRT